MKRFLRHGPGHPPAGIDWRASETGAVAIDPHVLEIAVVFAVMMGLFVTEVLAPDVVSMLVLVVLLLTGLVTTSEGLAGFSNEATITVGAFFVITGSIERTGALTMVAERLVRMARESSRRLLAYIMVLTAGCSTFLHGTGVVAVMLPVVINAARKHKESASRFLIPLSYAAQFGGVCTLVGTTSNILVSSILVTHHYAPIGMFEMTRLGIPLFLVGFTYLMTAGWALISPRRKFDVTEDYGLEDYLTELEVTERSPLIDRTLAASDLRRATGLHVIEIRRDGQRLANVSAQDEVHQADVLVAKGRLEAVMAACNRLGLRIRDAEHHQEFDVPGSRVVEVLLRPNSSLLGMTVHDAGFARRFGVVVLGIKRRQTAWVTGLRHVPLAAYDTLLLQGEQASLDRLDDRDFVFLEAVVTPRRSRRQLPLVLAVVVAVVILASIERLHMPVVLTSVCGAVLLLLTRVLTPTQAYRAVNWRVIFLMVGVMPMGTALEKWHVAADIAHFATIHLGSHPACVLSALYFLTMVLTEFVTHAACAVLMTPIALSAALGLGVDPRPFAIAVAFATATSFSTPVGYQTNAMVFGPGGYRFADFPRVGVALNLIFWLLSSWWIPLMWNL